MKKTLVIGFVIILSMACALGPQGSSATPGSTPTPTITLTPTPSPAQILFKASSAMLDMDSARFTLLREGDPIVLDAATGMTFNQAAGEYQAPDRVRATVKVGLLGTVLEIQIYWLPEGVFIQNPLTQRFESAPMDLGIDGAAIFKADGMPAVLATGIENPKRLGFEDIEGVATIHISGEADGATLAPVTAGALQAGIMYPVDVWVDRSTYIPVRVHVTEPDGSGWLIDLFDIDAEIEIGLP